MFVYWVTSNVFTVAQTALTRLPPVRRALGFPAQQQAQILTATAGESVSPFQAAVSRAKQNATVQTHVNKPSKRTTKRN